MLSAERTVPASRLVDDRWGDAVPETAPKMVQILVSQLRKALPRDHLVTRPPGYALDVPHEAIAVADARVAATVTGQPNQTPGKSPRTSRWPRPTGTRSC